VCIIARGKKLLDGKLKDLQRAAASDNLIALAFADASAKASGAPVLADPSLVNELRTPGGTDALDCEVKLASGADTQRLLAALVTAGAGLRRFEVVVPSLHQIFVDCVGGSAAVAERRPEGAA
jgi:ABC-2 type transport system ATP-binding protein